MIGRKWGWVVVAIAATLANLAEAAAQVPSATKPAAIVNGIPISWAEVDAVLKQAGPTATPLTEAQRKQMQLEAAGMLIDDLLMQQFLRKHGPVVDPAAVAKQIKELEVSLNKQHKTLQDFCTESGQTEAQLKNGVLTMLQWTAYIKVRVKEEEMKRYYEENREFFDRVAVRASHIVLRVSPNANEGERETARLKLQAIRLEIVTDKIDFAEAAKLNSQCTSAPGGGDLGFFPRKLAVEEPIARTAFALKVGEMSEVVETDFGVHLIKVTDRKSGQPSDYAKIKDEVRELCVEEFRQNLLNQQRKASRIEINLQ